MGDLEKQIPARLRPWSIVSAKIIALLVQQILCQVHALSDDAEITALQQSAHKEKDERLHRDVVEMKNSLPQKTKRAVNLTVEKGASIDMAGKSLRLHSIVSVAKLLVWTIPRFTGLQHRGFNYYQAPQ